MAKTKFEQVDEAIAATRASIIELFSALALDGVITADAAEMLLDRITEGWSPKEQKSARERFAEDRDML